MISYVFCHFSHIESVGMSVIREPLLEPIIGVCAHTIHRAFPPKPDRERKFYWITLRSQNRNGTTKSPTSRPGGNGEQQTQ